MWHRTDTTVCTNEATDAHRNTINTQYISRLIMISILLLKYLHMKFRLWCSGYEVCRLCLTDVNCIWSADYYLMLWLQAIPIGILISIWFVRQLGFDAWLPARRVTSVIWSGRLTHLHLASKLTIFFWTGCNYFVSYFYLCKRFFVGCCEYGDEMEV